MESGSGIDFLGDKFIDASGKEYTRADVLEGYKLVLLYITASWWGGCKPFGETLKEFYKVWNKDGAEKNIQVLCYTADRDENQFSATKDDKKWFFHPMNGPAQKAVFEKVKVSTIPRPCLINATTGDIIDENPRQALNDKYAEE